MNATALWELPMSPISLEFKSATTDLNWFVSPFIIRLSTYRISVMYALILAGGRGERLKPLTDSIPKPMVPILGKPILAYQIAFLKEAGAEDIIFLCGYKWEKIREYFGDGAAFGVRCHYSVEQTPLGRGGAIKKGMELVPHDEPFVIALNGDNITSQALGSVIDHHKTHDAVVTDMLVPYPSSYGVVEVDEFDRVTAFREKGELPIWINAGIYVLNLSVRPKLPDIGDHETATFPYLVETGQLYAFKSQAFWKTIDNHKDIQEVEEILSDKVSAGNGLT